MTLKNGAITQGYEILSVPCSATPSLTNLTPPSPPKTFNMLFIIQLLDIMHISCKAGKANQMEKRTIRS